MFELIIRIGRKKKVENTFNNDTESIEKSIDYWRNEYWQDLQKATFDSESKLEKYLFTISTGAVGLLLGTMSFINKPNGIDYMFYSFGAFVVSMILCVLYHCIAIRGHNKQFKMIENYVNLISGSDELIRKKIKRQNTFLDILHIISFVFIILGIILFVVYLHKNI